jgi:S-adenosyl methyltransferase
MIPAFPVRVSRNSTEAPMAADPPVPPGVNPSVPSPGRIYDDMLGGSYNFAVDRQVADRAMAAVPELRDIVLAKGGSTAGRHAGSPIGRWGSSSTSDPGCRPCATRMMIVADARDPGGALGDPGCAISSI